MCPFYRRRPLAPVERRTVWMAVAKEAMRVEPAARGIEFEEGDYEVAWPVCLPDPDGYRVEITTYEPAPA
jgi:hypothetical protein